MPAAYLTTPAGKVLLAEFDTTSDVVVVYTRCCEDKITG